uniref:Uncharacterized protein n=1 Tax=Knipowitschia caucasica TaxID=637954 RepID=A0AAV2K7Z9_KNICA
MRNLKVHSVHSAKVDEIRRLAPRLLSETGGTSACAARAAIEREEANSKSLCTSITSKDLNTTTTSKDVNTTTTSKDLNITTTSKDLNTITASKDLNTSTVIRSSCIITSSSCIITSSSTSCTTTTNILIPSLLQSSHAFFIYSASEAPILTPAYSRQACAGVSSTTCPSIKDSLATSHGPVLGPPCPVHSIKREWGHLPLFFIPAFTVRPT